MTQTATWSVVTWELVESVLHAAHLKDRSVVLYHVPMSPNITIAFVVKRTAL